MPKRWSTPDLRRIPAPARGARSDEVAEIQRRGPQDGGGGGGAGHRRQQRRQMRRVGLVPLEDQVVQARRGAPGPLDHLEHRRRHQPVAVQPQQEVPDEVPGPFPGDDPEVVAVVGDLVDRFVVPGGAGNAVLGRVAAGRDRGGRRRRNRREDRRGRLVHRAGVDEPLQRGQASGLNRGADHARRGGIDDDEQDPGRHSDQSSGSRNRLSRPGRAGAVTTSRRTSGST